METLSLNGSWKFRKLPGSDWVEAIVPGSVTYDLFRAGQLPDPYFRENEHLAIEAAKHDYEYIRTFHAEESFLRQEKIVLVCEGLDTIADIAVNGIFVAHTQNMHRTYEFDVKHLLKAGENTIAVTLFSPLAYIDAKEALNNGTWGAPDGPMKGFQHIRKAHCMFGWDWGPQIPDLGIWRSIYLLGMNTGRLKDVYITQKHTANQVALSIKVEAETWQHAETCVDITVTSPDGEVVDHLLAPLAGKQTFELKVNEPKIWWPNGYGAQPLYTVNVQLLSNTNKLDNQTYRIGLRTVGVRREKDAWGESFEFNVNGVSIFAMGADYIPEDNMLARCNLKRSEQLIKSCAEANFNCLRMWGGGYFADDWFYDLCDRYGLLLWQDFLFGCASYEFTDEFADEIRNEARDNIKRIRHHASLGLWCGNNEMEWGWEGWAFPKTPKLKTDYLKLFEMLLPEVLKEYDPNTFYWPASPSSGGSFDDPNAVERGDVHFWDVWHTNKPYNEYRKHLHRFVSEYGFQSLPSMKTIESFTLPEDRNYLSPVMESHQKSPGASGKILSYLSKVLKYPASLELLVYASQVMQADAIRYGVEHWRRHRGICMGSVYWQLNDCWPVTSWASIDYYGRWKALHYSAKRFYNPLLLSVAESETAAELHLSNETLQPASGTVVWKLRDNSSKVIREGALSESVDALSSKLIASLDFSDVMPDKFEQRKYYLEYAWIVEGKTVSAGSTLFVEPKFFSFFNPELSLEIEQDEQDFIITVSSNAFAKYIELDTESFDVRFDDNYFDLSAGSTRIIRANKASLSEPVTVEAFKKAIRARSIYDLG